MNFLESVFKKSFYDPAPGTALDCATLAWQKQPDAAAMQLMLKCLEPFHLQGELLPMLQEGIRLGILPESLVLTAARLAYDCYDHERAETILKSLKKPH